MVNKPFTDLLANYSGQGIAVVLQFISIPLYLKFLGAENFAFIGILATFNGLFAIMDMGISPTLSRTFSQININSVDKSDVFKLLRNFELILLGLFLFSLIVLIILKSTFAADWPQAQTLDTTGTNTALLLICLISFFRLFESIYRSAMVGMEKHKLLNGIISSTNILKVLLSVIYLYLSSEPSIHIFFIIHATIGALTAISLSYSIYSLNGMNFVKYFFSYETFKKSLRFTGGSSILAILSIIIAQSDKMLLAAFLPMEDFAYYTLAGTLGAVLHFAILPLLTVCGPKLVQSFVQHDYIEFASIFDQGSQVINTIVLSVGLVFVFYGFEIVYLWTSNQIAAVQLKYILPVMMTGFIVNSFLWMPHQAQISTGWVSLGIINNIISLLIIIPINYIYIPEYGSIVAPICWLVANMLSFVLTTIFMFNKILQNQRWKWLYKSILRPALLSLGSYFTLYQVMLFTNAPIIIVILSSITISLAFCVFASNEMFHHFRKVINQTKLYFYGK